MPKSRVNDVLALASAQDGYITTREAANAGITRRALAGMVERGWLERVARGVYRVVNRGEHREADLLSPYREVVMWAQSHRGPRVALSHETALAILGITDANPTRIHLTVPQRARLRRVPLPHVILHRGTLDDQDSIDYKGLPLTSVRRTILDLVRSGSICFAQDALHEARKAGFVSKIEFTKLRREMMDTKSASRKN
jgi:predicted transcriptional regulator of viral defense system